MGLIGKIKNILFDEEVVEVEVNSDELPEREEKEVSNKYSYGSRSGIIDHSAYSDDSLDYEDDDEDDVIKEVVVPKEETKTIEMPRMNENSVRERRFDFDDDFREKKVAFEPPVRQHNYEPRRDYASLVKEPPKHHEEEKRDYHSYLNKKTDDNKAIKKPFMVTPVISPVYGIIEETPRMAEEFIAVPEVKVDPSKPRMYGPVSYTDAPLPVKKYNMPQEDKIEMPEVKVNKMPEPVIEEEEEEIVSPNYEELDSISTSGVENEYLNEEVEDAFESTNEFEAINNEDLKNEEMFNPSDEFMDEEESTDDIINSSNDFDEDEHIDDTIETDLFNLIDSMYKDKEEEEE